MPNTFPLEELHIAQALKPLANRFAGTTTSGAVNMTHIRRAIFGILRGAGGVGTATITVEKSTDSAFTTPVAIPYEYRLAGAAGDGFGARTKADATGFLITAGADKTMVIEVRKSQLGSGFKYVRVKSVEGAAGAVDGAIVVLAIGPRFSGVQDIV